MAATIRDLARHCGLSVSAVSKALNGYSDISEETRQAVLAAAKALDYHPNAHARALKTGRSYNIGVLFSDDSLSGLTHPFFSSVLESFKKEAEAAGYDVTFISHHMGSGRVSYLDHCRYREVDGVCVACIDFDDREVEELIGSDLPLVTIDHTYENRHSVLSDNAAGVRMLLEYVQARGHRNIGYIYGQGSFVTDVRLKSFRQTARRLKLRIPREHLIRSEYTNPGRAREAALKLLRSDNRPSCIMVCDDYSALGVLQAANVLGLRVPDDLSVTGYDGIDQMQHFSPRLTTIRQDTDTIGRLSAKRLLSLIENPDQPPVCQLIPCTLIRGETVAPIDDGAED